ncbi:BQ2448_1561 [Microbotryum intermedium]|uniref:BQ2448_1561 protein n=1 Tax=Microbotryum intermedium TaxID=269621 RepID=A0A238FAG6_9BASI|nr:BQ2448_1561 [Microbotryum intermedium]
MSLFGQLLTHPSRVTFPWSALRHALNLYFASPPHLLDPAKIGSGWNGLSLILTSFKRLEVVQSSEETEEVLLWLTNLKSAAVKRRWVMSRWRSARFSPTRSPSYADHRVPFVSLQFEITTSPALQDILTHLLEPVTEEEMAIGRARYALFSLLPPPASIDLITCALLCRSQTHSSKPIGSAPTAASVVYDPFALEDLSNAAPRKRSVEIASIETGTSHKKSRPSVTTPSGGGENDAVADYDAADADGKGTKVTAPTATISRKPAPTTASSRRGSSTATIESKPAPAAARLNAEAVPASTSPAPSLSASRSKKTAAPVKPVVVPEAVDATPAVKKVMRIQRPHDPNRPNFSYSALIGQAILTAPLKRLRLSEIYDFVTNNYSYYKKNECGWQNSIRHNLSLQPVFKKIPDNTIPGKKGCFWTIIPSEEWRFANGGWTKLEKGSPVAATHQHHRKGKKNSANSSPSEAGAVAAASRKRKAAGAGAEAMDDDDDDDDDDDEGDGAMYTEDDD